MIAREDVDGLLNHFLFQIHTTPLANPDQAVTLVDFTAINIVTSMHSAVAQEGAEEVSETVMRERLLAVDVVADAVKQMIRTETEPARMRVYHTLIDLLADPESS